MKYFASLEDQKVWASKCFFFLFVISKAIFCANRTYKSFRFWCEKKYLRTKGSILQENRVEAGSMGFFGFFWYENKSLTLLQRDSPQRGICQLTEDLAWVGEYLLNFLRDWFLEQRADVTGLGPQPQVCFTRLLVLSLRWITWIRMASVLWSMLHSEVIWRLSSFWFSVTGQWRASSKGCLRRATPSNRPSSLQPAWATPR